MSIDEHCETSYPAVISSDVKTDTTPSLSGKSEITYTLGSDQDDALSIQLTGNTGVGHFSSEWIAYSVIQEARLTAVSPVSF